MLFKFGFSLLELLIVMAIIAILIAVAYPVYTSYLTTGRRNQAEVALLYLASQLEEFYSLENTYQGATLDGLGVNTYTDDHSYQLMIQSLTVASYTIVALPLNQQAKADSECGVLSLNELGEKTISGTANSSACWI